MESENNVSFVNVNNVACYKGSGKIKDVWYQFIITPSGEKQKTDMEVIFYTLNDKFQPDPCKIVGLFKKDFTTAEGTVSTYGGTLLINEEKYFVNFQKAKNLDEKTGKPRYYVKLTQAITDTSSTGFDKPLTVDDLSF